MTVHAIKAPAGLGKTTLVLEKIKSSAHKRIEIYVPTLALAREIHAKLVAQGESALVILGREQESEPEQTMCRKPLVAGVIARLGWPVFPAICMGAVIPGNKHTRMSCEYFGECSYLKQFGADARVFIYTHAYLPLPRNSKETAHPSLVIIDESFLSTCLVTHDISRGQLAEAAENDAAVSCVLNTLLKAVDNGQPILAALRSAGLTPEILREVYDLVSATGVGFLNYPDEEILRALRETGRLRARLDLLMDILAAELATARTESHGVTFDRNEQILSLHYRKPITRFRSSAGEPEILMIDANADAELIRAWFPEVTFKDIRVERKAHVIQCSSSRGSTTSFVPGKNKDPDSAERAAARLGGLQNLIDSESDGGKKKVLVVGPQAITGNPAKDVPALLHCPPTGALAHFNGLRGVDAYKDFDTAIIIGRNQPPIAELEDLARALWFDAEAPLAFAKDWVLEERPYRFRNPAESMGVEVLVHPDPRVQRLHEQLREGESTQAIDRLRLIHAGGAKRVIVVSNIPLDMEVDALVDLQTLLYRTRLERAWERLKGVLPLNPAWLSKTFPDLWPTPAAARTDLRAGGRSGYFSNSTSIRSLTTLTYEYRVAGQTRRSGAVSTLPLLATQDELTRLLGVAVVIRSVSGDTVGPEVNGAIGQLAFEPRFAFGHAEPSIEA